MVDNSAEHLINCHKASSDAYGQLVRATADICSPRYHYFCDDSEAKLPKQLVVVANTRRIPIRDNDLNKNGALHAVAVEGKSPGAMRLAQVEGRHKAEEMAAWKDSLHEDFKRIEQLKPRPNYVCIPEFGFPFGLEHQETMTIPFDADDDWKWLQGTEYLGARFVCLGSAHRQFFRTQDRQDMQYENVAVVYPNGKLQSHDAKKVFERKRDDLASVSEVMGVRFTKQASQSRGISAYFKEEDTLVTLRSQLSEPENADIDKSKIRFVKNAFDFYDSTADAGSPPVYIRKKCPARKLGEYIDAEGKIELDVFVTEFGVVAVLICYDAFEPSIFLSAVRMYYESLSREDNFYHQSIDLFFIPSFNKSEKFVNMCQILSRESNSTVVYVSGDDRCSVKSRVFVCGEVCSLWAEKIVEEEGVENSVSFSEYFSYETVKGHSHLHIYTISDKLIYAARHEMGRQFPRELRQRMILDPRRMGSSILD